MTFRKTSGFYVNLMTTFIFAAAVSLIPRWLPSITNQFIRLAIVIGLWILLSIVAGLVVREKLVTYYVSIVFVVVVAFTSFFPLRYINIGVPIGGTILASFFGLLVGLISEGICGRVQSYIEGERRIGLLITRKSLFFGALFLAAFTLSVFAFIHLESVVAYFDQHPWVVTILSIIATAILTFFGGKYYGRRGAEEQ
jgi:hypothetical protein